MAENKEYITCKENEGNILISEEVIAKICTATTSDVIGFGGFLMNTNVSDYIGANRMAGKGIRVDKDGDGFEVHLFVVIKYGYVLGDVAKKIQASVFDALQDMVGSIIKSVNVHVGGICFNEDKK